MLKHVVVSLYFILPIALSYHVHAQGQDDLRVVFFRTEANKDSTTVFSNNLDNNNNQANGTGPSLSMSILSNTQMNGNLHLKIQGSEQNRKSKTQPANNTCLQAIIDGSDGANVLFLGQEWDNQTNGKMSGDGYITFMGKDKQTIKQERERASFPGIQINNPKHVYLQGSKSIQVEHQARFQNGNLHVTADTLVFGKQASTSCSDKYSYVQLPSPRMNTPVVVAKDTNVANSTFKFMFPLGSDKSYSPVTVVMKHNNVAASTGSNPHPRVWVAFDNKEPNDVSAPKGSEQRYDKSGLSFWYLKSNLDSTKVDSVYVGLERTFSQENTSKNFRADRAFITEYVGATSNSQATNPSTTNPERAVLPSSNWDRPTLSEKDLRPSVSTISKAGKKTVMFTYRRAGTTGIRLNGKTTTTKPEYSYYALSNYDDNPLTARFDKVNMRYDQDACVLNLQWIFKDKFAGQRYYVRLMTDTSDAAAENENSSREFVINDNEITYSTEERLARYTLSFSRFREDIFSPPNQAFAQILEKDLGGKTRSVVSEPFAIKCGTGDGQESDILVSAVGNNGSGGVMTIRYDAEYAEELRFSVFNVLGQKEADLGYKDVFPGRNTLTLNLPTQMLRSQRYVLLISGGTLNQKAKTYSVSFTIQ